MSTRMAKTQFWWLTKPESQAKRAEWIDEEIETQKIVCPIDSGHRRGGKRLTNLSVTLPGVKVEDIVWTWYSECLIQDHVLALFRENGLTGFDVKPVEARFKKPRAEPPPKLWELVVTGWGGMAPPESGIRLLESCSACGLLEYSKVTNPEKFIDASRWDGSDFFTVWPLPRFIFLSDRAANVIRSARLKGALIQSMQECADDLAARQAESALTAGFGPGRLSYYMPEARAHELGDELGIF